MRTFLTIVWHFPFFGFLQALAFLIVGVLQCLTIIFIPTGLGTIQIGVFLFNPFNKALINKDDMVYLRPRYEPTSGFMKVFNILNRILYFIPGCLTAASMIFSTLGFFISIIGIPCGLVYARTIPAIFNPINKICVTKEEADKIEQIKRSRVVDGVNEVKDAEPISTYVDDVKTLLWPAAQRYYALFIYLFIIIADIIFWQRIFATIEGEEAIAKARLLGAIIYNLVVVFAYISLTFKCCKRYIISIIILTLSNIAFVVAYANARGELSHSISLSITTISLFLPIALAVVANNSKNYMVRASALGLIAISAVTLLWSRCIADFLITKLVAVGNFTMLGIVFFVYTVLVSACVLIVFALLVVGLYKDDCQRGVVECGGDQEPLPDARL